MKKLTWLVKIKYDVKDELNFNGLQQNEFNSSSSTLKCTDVTWSKNYIFLTDRLTLYVSVRIIQRKRLLSPFSLRILDD